METTKLTQVYGLNPEELTQKIVLALEQLFALHSPTEKIEKDNDAILLTRNEACKYLKISKATLNNWSNLGIVKKHKIGNLVRYKETELKNALTSSKVVKR